MSDALGLLQTKPTEPGLAARNVALYVLSCAAFVVTFDTLLVSAVLPKIARDLAIPEHALGWLAGSYAASFGLSAIVMAPLADSLGRRNLLLVGGVLFAIANALGGTAGSFHALLVYRLAAGVGAAMVMPGVWATVGSLFPPRAVMSAMSVVWAFISLSMIVGVPAASFLAGDSWKAMFFGTAGISLPLLVAFAFLPLGSEPPRGEPYLTQFRRVLGHTGALRSLLATFFWNLSLFSTFSLVGAFYFSRFALNTRQIGLTMLVGGLGTFLGTLLARKLGAKLDRRVVVRGCALACALLVAPFTLAFNLPVSLALQVLWSFVVGFGAGALSAIVSAQQPKARGTLMSLNSATLNAAVAVGGALSGGLVELGHGGFVWVGVLSSVAAIAAAAVVPDAPGASPDTGAKA